MQAESLSKGQRWIAFRAWLNSNKGLYNFDTLIEKAVTSYLVTGNSLVYAGSIMGYDEGLNIEDTMPYCAHMPDVYDRHCRSGGHDAHILYC